MKRLHPVRTLLPESSFNFPFSLYTSCKFLSLLVLTNLSPLSRKWSDWLSARQALLLSLIPCLYILASLCFSTHFLPFSLCFWGPFCQEMQILRFNGVGEAMVESEMESLPSGGDLELGLGINGGCGALIKEQQGRVVFTRAQIEELLFQGTVFRYLRQGLPVPINLVFPIWNSVVCSLKIEVVLNRFPNLARLFGLKIPGMVNDPEPVRCIKTDSKKWRCLKAAVHHHKYCERHLRRSRKHVEAYQHALKPSVPTVSTSPDLVASGSHSEKRALGILEAGSSSYDGNGNGDWERQGKSVEGDINGTKRSRSSIHKSTNIFDTNVSNLGYHGSFEALFSPGFGFIPTGNASVCTRLDLDQKIPEVKETEPQRCIRTYGKKWRCKQDAAPDNTYCEVHMLRGSNRKARDLKTLSVKGDNSSSSATNDSSATLSD